MTEDKQIVPAEQAAEPNIGFRRVDLQLAVRGHLNSIKLTDDPTKSMLPTYIGLRDLETMVRELRQEAGEKFVDVLEFHATDVPQWEPKKNLAKGEDKRQKVDENGKPIFKHMPAEIVVGDTRYMAKFPRQIKAKLKGKEAIRCVFEAVGGDIDEFLEVLPAILSSDAFKQSEVKNCLGEQAWDQMYEVEYGRRIDGNETPRKREIAELSTFFVNKAIARTETMRLQREAKDAELDDGLAEDHKNEMKDAFG